MDAVQQFRDRADAGRMLATRLRQYAGHDDVIVLALPRGGVPVGAAVADALGATLDVFLVRKLGVPGHEELAMGAIASGGVRVLNRDVIDDLEISDRVIDAVTAHETRELERRERLYRDSHSPAPVDGRVVILVDDGLATGSTMRAAAAALRAQKPARLIIAVPAAPADTCAELRRDADEIVCASTPEPFYSVGLWYEDFTQTTDEEVRALLARARGGNETGRTTAEEK